ncbi:RNA-directed DNA polymerase [Candidatus Kuenenia sp.]|jgi:retron-type reverse transcriptase|uniref:RNA-directed DNA polymerase n=1 Tax=Candidatus Kuenenia sp. TaxID=2499824 RepID=UPI00321FA9B3
MGRNGRKRHGSRGLIIRADITNFYNSVYTHSIGWAIHGREEAFKDNECLLTGNKIDRLIQYANDGRTNGIPVGSALSDLIAEIILSSIDRKVSNKKIIANLDKEKWH